MIRRAGSLMCALVVFQSLVVFAGQAAIHGVAQADDAGRTSPKGLKPVAAAPIDGVVVDEEGRPVSGATVQTNRSCGMVATTATRPDGTFRFQPPWPFDGVVVLVASSPDRTRRGSVWVNRGTTSASYRIVLRRARMVDVSVVDAAGNPVADATVHCFAYSYSLVDVQRTDSQGKTRLYLPVATETGFRAEKAFFCITASKSGVGMDYHCENGDGERVDEKQAAAERVKLVLKGAMPFEVQLVDSDGKPMPGLIVSPSRLAKDEKDTIYLWGMDGLVTDAKGCVRFDWLPTDVTMVEFSARDGNYTYNEDIEFRVLEGGSRERLVVKLRKPAIISGRVTAADGKPAVGLLVQAEGTHASCNYFRGDARTDVDGTYWLRVDPNEVYLIGVVDKEWTAPSHVNIVLKEGETREHLDFRLCKGTLVHGRITVGPEKRPYKSVECEGVPYVAVAQCGPETEIPAEWSCSGSSCRLKPGTAVKCSSRLCRWANVDADGRYAIRLCPGNYTLRFPLEFEKQVPLVVGEQTEIVRDSNTPRLPCRRFQIRTIDAAGKPVAECQLIHDVNMVAKTDREGRLAATLGREDTALYARNQQANLAGFKMVPKDDRDEVVAAIEMRPAASLTGRVVDGGGRPVAGAQVFCNLRKLQPRAEACFFRTKTKTDNDGKYVIAGLFPGFQGELTVSRFNAAARSYEKSEMVKFDMTAGESRRPDLILRGR
jgi:protocatechuate 3,4-dioxygenase beta subunit